MTWHFLQFACRRADRRRNGPAARRRRTASRLALGLALLLFAGRATAGAAEGTNAPATNGFQAFKLIADRNIFNQNRTPGNASERARPPERQARVETFSLLGTLRYEKGEFAFFDGNNSEFRKVLKPSDTIGGCRIVEVGHNSVKLAAGDKQVELAVGMQMTRQDEGEWQVTARSSSDVARSDASRSGDRDSFRSRDNGRESRDFRTREFSRRDRSSGESSEASRPSTGSSPSGGSEDEILRRLMERRQRE